MTDPDDTLPAVEVTFLEDRARVLRRGVLDGATRSLRIEGVAPAVVDKTLSARVVNGNGRVVSATVRRERVLDPRARDEEIRDLELALEAAQDDLVAQRAELTRLTEELTLLATTATQMTGEMAEDTAWSRTDPEAWSQTWRELHGSIEARRVRDVTLRHRMTEARAELARRRLHLESLREPRHRMACWIDLEVDGDGARTVELAYLVPGALWRPAHRATLGADGRLRWEALACVWQNTGETWRDVTVRLSTERRSLGVEPPRLSTDRLAARPRSKKVHVETRQQAVETTGPGGEPPRPEVPGIDDGGDVLSLVAEHPVTLPSDGRPHRTRLFTMETDAEQALICAPEIEPAVVLRTRQVNRAERPLLAGPVALVRQSGYVGRGRVLYVAPGERFDLGWGPDGAVRVHREVEEEEITAGLLSGWAGAAKTVTARLSNLGPDEKVVEVQERIPVSEIDKVQVEHDAKDATPSATPDADGILRWTLTLKGRARSEVKLEYRVRHHRDVEGL